LERRKLLDVGVVEVTETPRFTRLVRANHGRFRRMLVLGGMSVRRVIAAADVPAAEAKSQVHPFVPGRQALAATLCTRANGRTSRCRFQMRTGRTLGHVGCFAR